MCATIKEKKENVKGSSGFNISQEHIPDVGFFFFLNLTDYSLHAFLPVTKRHHSLESKKASFFGVSKVKSNNTKTPLLCGNTGCHTGWRVNYCLTKECRVTFVESSLQPPRGCTHTLYSADNYSHWKPQQNIT